MSWQEYESRKAARRSGRSILQRGSGDPKDYCTPGERRAVEELAADPVIAARVKAHGDLKAPSNIVESQKRIRTVSWQEHPPAHGEGVHTRGLLRRTGGREPANAAVWNHQGQSTAGGGRTGGGMTRRVCAWCRTELGRIPDGPDGVTHGICRPCKRRVLGTEIGRCLDATFDAAAWAVLVFGYLVVAWMLYDLLVLPAPAGETMRVVATGYSWREPSHRRWGTANAIGGRLDRPVQGMEQIAVDPRRIPLGSILNVPGAGRRIATDTGSAVRVRHIDIHWPSLCAMQAWGTRILRVEILRLGWGERASHKTTQRNGVPGKGVARAVDLGDARKLSQQKPKRPGEKRCEESDAKAHAARPTLTVKTSGRRSGLRRPEATSFDLEGRRPVDRRSQPQTLIALDAKGRSTWRRR